MKTLYKSSLTREKFVVKDVASANPDAVLVEYSNRLELNLITPDGDAHEDFVIRCQNMHVCVRLAAKMYASFRVGGPIMNRPERYRWEEAFAAVTSEYERRFNPALWIAVYTSTGKLAFSHGDNPVLVDVIEMLGAKTDGTQTGGLSSTRGALEAAGKQVDIEHDSNIALSLNLETFKGSVAIEVMGEERATSLRFNVSQKEAGQELNIPLVMNAAAAALEAIELCHYAGYGEQKRAMNLVIPKSDEENQIEAAAGRINGLDGEIRTMEGAFTVSYRPERPDFAEMKSEAFAAAHESLAAEHQQLQAEG